MYGKGKRWLLSQLIKDDGGRFLLINELSTGLR